jgi:hypothetical protein
MTGPAGYTVRGCGFGINKRVVVSVHYHVQIAVAVNGRYRIVVVIKLVAAPADKYRLAECMRIDIVSYSKRWHAVAAIFRSVWNMAKRDGKC